MYKARCTRLVAQGELDKVTWTRLVLGCWGDRATPCFRRFGRTNGVDLAALCHKKKSAGMSADRQLYVLVSAKLHVLVSAKIERDGFRQQFTLLRG